MSVKSARKVVPGVGDEIRSGAVQVSRRPFEVAFQLGLALFVAAQVWEFWEGPARSTADQRWRLVWCGAAFALAACSWVVGSALPWRRKAAWVCGIGAVTLFLGINSARNFDADESVLTEGRIEGTRFVHSGLGLSFDLVPGWETSTQLAVKSPAKEGGTLKRRLRLGMTEKAIIFRAAAAPSTADASPNQRWIQVQVLPLRFPRCNVVVMNLRRFESDYEAEHGVKITRPTLLSRSGNHDIAEFEFENETDRSFTRQVYVRSGACLVNLVLHSTHDEDRPRFERMVGSIRVVGRKSRFDP